MKNQKPLLRNLKLIRNELNKKNWSMDVFLFKYKNQEYIVLLKVYSENEKKKSSYAMMKIEFIRKENSEEIYSTYADLLRINIPDMKKFRDFFGIEYGNNLGDIINQFTNQFAKCIPGGLRDKNEELNKYLTKYVTKSDSNGRYCIGVFRNGIKKDGLPGQRSPENNQKAEMLIPSIHKMITDYTLSFHFSEDQSKEKTKEEILISLGKK